MQKINNWIKNNKVVNKKKEFWILIGILLVGAFFRLYRIGDYMTFLGDEGRDVIVVHRFLTEFHPPLIGPGTSVGNMYLGPLYYYMMAPALLIANFSPIGPAIQIAILGIITIWFVWYICREWFPENNINWGALVAAGLYAISPVVINFSRSSWNPNIMPFFALLSIYSIWKVYYEHKFNWLLVLGVSFAFVLQSHYLGLLLVPTLFIFWLKSRSPIRYTLYAIAVFLILMSPLLLFDLRHNFQNFNAFKVFFSPSGGLGFSLSTFFFRVLVTIQILFVNLIGAKNIYVGLCLLVLSFSIGIYSYYKNIFSKQLLLISLWLFFGIIGLAYYKGEIYEHYLGFLFPVPFLLIGYLFQKIFEYKSLFPKLLFSLVLVVITFLNIKNNPPLVDPTYQMPRAIAVAKMIQEKSAGRPFNLAAISDFNNREVYEYFLMIWGTKVVDTDPSSLDFTVTDQLFVVCENTRNKCDPTHNASAWITKFGWTKIEDEWPVWGGTLFKLGHTK